MREMNEKKGAGMRDGEWLRWVEKGGEWMRRDAKIST